MDNFGFQINSLIGLLCLFVPCLALTGIAIGGIFWWSSRRSPAPRPPAEAGELAEVVEHHQKPTQVEASQINEAVDRIKANDEPPEPDIG